MIHYRTHNISSGAMKKKLEMYIIESIILGNFCTLLLFKMFPVFNPPIPQYVISNTYSSFFSNKLFVHKKAFAAVVAQSIRAFDSHAEKNVVLYLQFRKFSFSNFDCLFIWFNLHVYLPFC